jgi:hypothetical protein
MKNFKWTKHSEKKIKYYGLSKSRILKVIKNPFRIEEGIAPQTIAMMQPARIKKNKNKKIWKQEIWTMIQKDKETIKIISAWRYPGISPQTNPIPSYIIDELEKEGYFKI